MISSTKAKDRRAYDAARIDSQLKAAQELQIQMKQQHDLKFKIYRNLKQAMQDTESYAASSNQTVAETIASLNHCIQNNGEGLQRAMNDLQALTEREQRESNV